MARSPAVDVAVPGAPARAEALRDWRSRPPVPVRRVSDGRVHSVGAHLVLGPLGEGGMGLVLEVQTPSGERGALKLLKPEVLEDPSWNASARLAREIDVMLGLDHPNLVRVIDAGRADDEAGCLPFVVMEKIEGRCLRELEVDGLALDDALKIASDLAAAIEALDAAGLTHRDLKPLNVMVRPDGSAVLLDFGLARRCGDLPLTAVGKIVGTFGYMAPERLYDDVEGISGDVFALGVMGFEMLAFSDAPRGRPSAPAVAALAHRYGHGPDFAAFEEGQALEALLAAMLEVLPARRPSPRSVRLALDLVRRRRAAALRPAERPTAPLRAPLAVAPRSPIEPEPPTIGLAPGPGRPTALDAWRSHSHPKGLPALRPAS